MFTFEKYKARIQRREQEAIAEGYRGLIGDFAKNLGYVFLVMGGGGEFPQENGTVLKRYELVVWKRYTPMTRDRKAASKVFDALSDEDALSKVPEMLTAIWMDRNA